VNHPHQFSFIWRRNIPSDTNAEGIYKYKLMTKNQLITTTKDQYSFNTRENISSWHLRNCEQRALTIIAVSPHWSTSGGRHRRHFLERNC